MRSGIRVVFLVVFALTLSEAAVLAQSLTPCVRSTMFSIQTEPFISGRGLGRPGYTATVKHTFERTLADGNTIHWTSESVQARDQTGRTFSQRVDGCELDENGQPQLRTQVDIYDPTAKTSTHWSTGPGTMALATINHQGTGPQPDWKDIPRTPSIHTHPEMTHEDLGTRTIAGMQATGSRTTEIIPAGAEGNDLPLKVVHENWSNNQNHLMLMIVLDDPRNGRTTWEIESLTIGPPDPALFTPPANYKVWDNNPQPQTTATP